MTQIENEILCIKEVDSIRDNTITLKEGYENIEDLKDFQEKVKKITGNYPTPCDVNILDWFFEEKKEIITLTKKGKDYCQVEFSQIRRGYFERGYYFDEIKVSIFKKSGLISRTYEDVDITDFGMKPTLPWEVYQWGKDEFDDIMQYAFENKYYYKKENNTFEMEY